MRFITLLSRVEGVKKWRSEYAFSVLLSFAATPPAMREGSAFSCEGSFLLRLRRRHASHDPKADSIPCSDDRRIYRLLTSFFEGPTPVFTTDSAAKLIVRNGGVAAGRRE